VVNTPLHEEKLTPDPVSEIAFTRRLDRFAATLCFLLAAFALAVVAVAVIDFARGCPGSRHGCFYSSLGFPIFLGIALVATLGGLWLWPRRSNSGISTPPPKRENDRR
jgi:hypothetical protein